MLLLVAANLSSHNSTGVSHSSFTEEEQLIPLKNKLLRTPQLVAGAPHTAIPGVELSYLLNVHFVFWWDCCSTSNSSTGNLLEMQILRPFADLEISNQKLWE